MLKVQHSIICRTQNRARVYCDQHHPKFQKPPIMSAISSLEFPFKLTKDQIEAVDAWITKGIKG
jgi:hypothetical protein